MTENEIRENKPDAAQRIKKLILSLTEKECKELLETVAFHQKL